MTPSETRSEKQYQTILDSITDGVYTVNLDWRVTYFNRAAEKITGIPRKEAIGRSCLEVFRSNVCESNCIVRETMDTNRPIVNKPIYFIRADKKRIPVSVTTTLLKDSRKKIVGGVVTFRDLTDLSKLRKALLKQHSYEDIVSKSPIMNRIFATLPQISRSQSTVFIEGASGTGKELIARAIHNNSFNNEGPFVAVNCGALPDTLVESELFGYKAGAFTDAKTDKPGRFAQAQNGTLLLDEIGDISPVVQVRLLRVLENREYEPLGATTSIHTNARIITATHHNLEKRVKEGKFREDLYYRINVVKLSLPAIKDRKEDIPLLVNHFIERFNHLTGKNIIGISQEAMAALMLYDWPGNVREIENAIEHAFVLCLEDFISLACLPDQILPATATNPILPGLTLKEIEKRAIQQALERNQGKKVKTAKELGIDKNTLRRKMIRFGITPPR
ncbi:MAG: sigma 54-interacting transcriptional regulator [Desulfosarcina sp.]|nr:sigma 54-interacting transcriptional regulator [Desulfosarcina sp.]MBC2742242.1 sigma 54-interacting transcriptional regulator [Desulfosarcina sp.]MBC2765154.1 sigma 54-interacting transcriptional regulator [Desulfosarcina sp.]